MRLDGKIVKKPCKECGHTKVIVYQKGVLCHRCNDLRLQEARAQKSKDRERKAVIFDKGEAAPELNKLKKQYSINNLSSKGAKRRQEYRDLCKEIDQEAIDDNKYYCWGCGSGSRPLSHSHTIAKSQRKDLELDKDNLELECLDWGGVKGCHNIWETGTLEEQKKLLNFDRKIEYIKRTDSMIFNKYFSEV